MSYLLIGLCFPLLCLALLLGLAGYERRLLDFRSDRDAGEAAPAALVAASRGRGPVIAQRAPGHRRQADAVVPARASVSAAGRGDGTVSA